MNPPEKGRGRYPRAVEEKVESPPQYMDWDAEEDDSDPDTHVAEAAQHAKNATSALGEQQLDAIFALVQKFCESHLTTGYVEVCARLLDAPRGA